VYRELVINGNAGFPLNAGR